MNRTKFFEKETVNQVEEFDFLNSNFSNFVMSYQPGFYRVKDQDLMRPDMISYKIYGTVNYWWLICYVNGIFDPFNDLTPGQLLSVPNVLDIYAFYKKYRKR